MILYFKQLKNRDLKEMEETYKSY